MTSLGITFKLQSPYKHGYRQPGRLEGVGTQPRFKGVIR